MVFFYVIPILNQPKGLEKAIRFASNCETYFKKQLNRERNQHIPKSRQMYLDSLALPGKVWKDRFKKAEPWIQQELRTRRKKKAGEDDDLRAEFIAEKL